MPHVEQLFLSMLLPNHNDAVVTFGKFNAPFGIERRDFWDRLTGSATLLFIARPQDLVGAMVTYPIPDWNLTLRPMVVNGFNQNIDYNQQPSFACMTEWQPTCHLSLAVTNWFGPEFPDDNTHKLFFTDAQLSWTAIDCLTLQAEYLDVRSESQYGPLDWRSAAAIASYHWSKQTRLFAQYSWLDDPWWFFSPVPQWIQQFSVGLSYFLHPHVEFRGEYRHDFAHRVAPGYYGAPGDYQSSNAPTYVITSGSQDSFFLNLTFGY